MAWSPFRSGLFTGNAVTEDGSKNSAKTQAREGAGESAYASRDENKLHRTNIMARSGSLDAIGQRGELVRMRVVEMISRLEDLKTLQDDFSSMLEPLVAISEELPRATTRLAEVEALFAKEQQSAVAARREVGELSVKTATLANELAAMTTEVARLENSAHSRDIELDQLRIAWRDKALLSENLERQLAGEADQTKALSSENKALRLEAQVVDQALSRSEHDLAEARERLALLDQDNRRLQLLCEEQEARLSDAVARYDALKDEAEIERQRLHSVEAELTGEIAARQKSEAQQEAENGALRTERASLAMKLEAATNRISATEQLLAQLRSQLREKDEAYRVVERAAKEAAIERVTSDRRLDSTQTDLARQTERLLEAQRLRSEADNRCDMLTKALAAKDVAIEQATSRAAALSDRIDLLNLRRESDVHELEMANRRLVEELQSERSERALAQGALDIARESRISLQKQHEALKRSTRGIRGLEDVDPTGQAATRAENTEEQEKSNVRPFNSSGRSTS